MKANFRLKEARFEKKVTQQELADAIGVTVMTYSNRENGKYPFTEPEMQKIADVLGKKVTDIFFNQ
jgi:DNA-binding XRE family transcriptional regulator